MGAEDRPDCGLDGRLVVLPKERLPQHLLQPGNTAQHWEADSTRIREELGTAKLFLWTRRSKGRSNGNGAIRQAS